MGKRAKLLSLVAGSAVLLLPGSGTAQSPPTTPHGDYVVLLHGLGRTALSMCRMKSSLTACGYRVISVTYPSSRFPVQYLSDVWLDQLLHETIRDPGARVHFVTHSLGGIILRQYLSNHSIQNLGRVVMLAPPNHGSQIIDLLKASPITRQLLGPSRLELGTGKKDLPAQLGPPNFECGIIAGDRSLNPFLSAMLTGPNDGKVTLQSARLEGMRDFLVLHSTHTWLMWRTRTIRQTLQFLRSGHFYHAA